MPAAPYRDDEDGHAPPVRTGTPRPRAVSSHPPVSADTDRRPRRAGEPRAPALEGLTTTGAAVVGLVGATLVALLDAMISPGLGWLFFVGFFVTSAFVGLRLRGRDSWALLAVPPLVYIGAAGVAAQLAPATEGSWVRRTSGDMAAVVLDHPVILLVGAALAVVAFVYRAAVS